MTERFSLHFHYVHIPSCVIYSCCFWCDFRSYAFIVLNFFQMLLQIIFYFLLIFHTLIFDCLISFLSLHKEPKFSFFKNREMCVCVFSHIWLFVIPWTVVCQGPLSMGFSRQECWKGLPFPFPGDLPDPGIELASLGSPALAGRFFIPLVPLGKPPKER